MNTKDEEEIYKEKENFINAWNNGNAKDAAGFFTEDGVRVGAFGDVQHSKNEIEIAFEKLLHHSMPGAKAKQGKGSVRMLTREFAIWQAELEIEKPDGSPSLKGYVVEIMKKIEGRWLVLESHPKFFPPQMR